MNDVVRISVYLVSFAFCLYTLQAIDFSILLRKGSERKGQMLYLLLSIALAYLVAQFLLGLSINFIVY